MLKQYSSAGLKHSKWGKPSSVAAGSTGGLNTAQGAVLWQRLLFARDAQQWAGLNLSHSGGLGS